MPTKRRAVYGSLVKQAIVETDALFGLTALMQPRFGLYMQSWRSRAGMTLREVAADAQVPMTTWARGEHGYDLQLSSVIRIIAWASVRRLTDATPEEYAAAKTEAAQRPPN